MAADLSCDSCSTSYSQENLSGHIEQYHVGPRPSPNLVQISCGSCSFRVPMDNLTLLIQHCSRTGHSQQKVTPNWKMFLMLETERIQEIVEIGMTLLNGQTVANPGLTSYPEEKPIKTVDFPRSRFSALRKLQDEVCKGEAEEEMEEGNLTESVVEEDHDEDIAEEEENEGCEAQNAIEMELPSELEEREGPEESTSEQPQMIQGPIPGLEPGFQASDMDMFAEVTLDPKGRVLHPSMASDLESQGTSKGNEFPDPATVSQWPIEIVFPDPNGNQVIDLSQCMETREVPKPKSTKETLKCLECGYVTPAGRLVREAIRHVFKHDRLLEPFKCGLCDATGGIDAKLFSHWKRMHSGPPNLLNTQTPEKIKLTRALLERIFPTGNWETLLPPGTTRIGVHF